MLENFQGPPGPPQQWAPYTPLTQDKPKQGAQRRGLGEDADHQEAREAAGGFFTTESLGRLPGSPEVK